MTITAEYLVKGAEEAAHTILHEMCHYVNYLKGISDCNKSGYHNSKFKFQAEFVGLKVEKVRQKGYALTLLTDKLRQEIESFNINNKVFDIFRIKDKKVVDDNKNKQLTYDCGCTRIKSTKEVDSTCNLCVEITLKR